MNVREVDSISLFHFHVTQISRAAGQSAIASAAYRAGEKLHSDYYGEDSDIENCLVADGCFLEGEVENSVLFRQVTVEKDAEVENCVIMNDAVIGEGAELKYAILDKNVTVTAGAKLIGTKQSPIIVRRGETV